MYNPIKLKDVVLIQHKMPIITYLKLLKRNFGLFKLSDSGYPIFLARAFIKNGIIYSYLDLRKHYKLLWHELGHEVGFKHSKDRKNVMYPMFFRGTEGIPEIMDVFFRWNNQDYIFLSEVGK